MCLCLDPPSCLTLCDPMDCSLPGSSVHGILQATILEWVAMPSSRGSSQPRDGTHVSCNSFIGRRILYHWATWKAWRVIILNNKKGVLYHFSLLLVSCCSDSKLCLTLCNPVSCIMPGFSVLHYLPEFAQMNVHWVSDAIQPLNPLFPPSFALNLSQHQCHFQWVSSSHQVTKVLEFQLSLSPPNEYSGSIYGIILLQYLFSLHCNYLFTCWPLLLIYKLPEGKKHALFVLSASTQHSS